jgi:hypothetical protein
MMNNITELTMPEWIMQYLQTSQVLLYVDKKKVNILIFVKMLKM